jgi:hypothetical protein
MRLQCINKIVNVVVCALVNYLQADRFLGRINNRLLMKQGFNIWGKRDTFVYNGAGLV